MTCRLAEKLRPSTVALFQDSNTLWSFNLFVVSAQRVRIHSSRRRRPAAAKMIREGASLRGQCLASSRATGPLLKTAFYWESPPPRGKADNDHNTCKICT